MSDPFIGEIRMFGGNFAPNGWAFCSGQLLPISQNEALFNLIGTYYGGDGVSTFALPNLQGRRGVHFGSLSGGSTYVIGEEAGVEAVTLSATQLPSHTHTTVAVAESGTVSTPNGNSFAQWSDDPFAPPGTATAVALASAAMGPAGSSQAHENRSPFLVVSYIISLFGIFPSRN